MKLLIVNLKLQQNQDQNSDLAKRADEKRCVDTFFWKRV